MSDDGLRPSNVLISALVLLVNCCAVGAAGALVLHQYRPLAGWATALGYSRSNLISPGLLCIGTIAAAYAASRPESAYAYLVYASPLALSLVIASSGLVLFCGLNATRSYEGLRPAVAGLP
jgi:hypothetical protein